MKKYRLSTTSRALLLTTAASLAVPAFAHSEAMLPAAAASTEPPAEEVASPDPDDQDYDDEEEIVVTGQRLAGQLDTDFAAEVELDEAAVASYGVSSVEELLAAIEPITRSGRGRGSGRPVLLVNGRRISGFGAVRNIPPEAIAKVEVFPEEVALQYGYAATERVVNIVLKPNFRQISAEAEAGVPTQGGQFKSELEPGFIAIGETGRLNLNASWEHQTMLLESERDLQYESADRAAEAPARSLLPASDEYRIEGTIVRNLDKVTDVQGSLRFDQTDSLALLGPGDGGPGDPLRRDSRTQNWEGSASVNGMLDSWRWSVTGNYSDSDQRIFTDRTGGTTDRFDSSQRNIGANANISGSVIEGWAGPLQASITGGFTSARYDSRAATGGDITTSDLGRDTPSVFGSLTVPLLDPDYNVGKVGRLSLTLNAQAERPSDFSALTSWGATFNWGLTGNLSLIASYKRDEAAPSMTQLGAAPLTTDGVTTYDFATGQTVEITTITGGNPDLLTEKRQDIKLGLNWDVPMLDGLSFSIDYNHNRSDDTANSFPLLTPEIEAAFPDRVVRDTDGTLLAVDLRPVNFDRATNSQIRWGFNFGKSFGEPKTGPGESSRRERSTEAPPPGGPPPEGGDAPPRREGSAGEAQQAGPPPGASSGGPPRGGRGMGRRGGGRGFGRPQGGRWQVSLYHTFKLTDTVLIRPGVPELDLLNGSATGSGGGSNRNLVELDGGVFYKGVGARVRAKYDSGSSVVGGANGDLTFHPLATFDLRFFADFGQMPKVTGDLPFLKNSRLRLSIDNLFDAQRRVTDAGGAVPLSYQPGYTDPLGRYIELEWRKSF
ncbi:TonB-dependent receptor plug domain-containing protein [Sphingopyxis indica]|uniref:TonB-dependent receptor plug domain-containing protein n=1 Tax=Sphingopyxis indica TaxID=436663 RepID=UPI00293915AC|nr:ABC transporter ATP-binding protein [Sphingopyxis indica]WOF42165.1 TonB-dependent receptor plug domain-containing protein [Sphingopyxis indica]